MFAKTMSETSEEGYKEMQFHYKSDNILSLLLIDVLFNSHDYSTKNDNENNNNCNGATYYFAWDYVIMWPLLMNLIKKVAFKMLNFSYHPGKNMKTREVRQLADYLLPKSLHLNL